MDYGQPSAAPSSPPLLVETNWLIGGRSGQGKSAAMRTLLLGAALDPSAELWVFVMGESPDFEPFRPRLGRYRMGMDDAVAQAALQALQDLLVEMERRGKLLGAQPGRPLKISRKLADVLRWGTGSGSLVGEYVHKMGAMGDQADQSSAASAAAGAVQRAGRRWPCGCSGCRADQVLSQRPLRPPP